jgi:hypothetical protein
MPVYTATNSLLDMMINGCCGACIGTFCVAPAVNATQPDTADANVAVVGAGPPYQLSGNPTVNTCKDKNGTVQPLAACLQAAAYSFYFKFSADRVIAKPCRNNADCPTGLTCTGGSCQ